ncbi:hypothetical protein GWA97_13505 [Flavobacterium sp. LaA7.5]|nr:hypothetical protein [Flavobacterium salilacus subsp. altitudinum]
MEFSFKPRLFIYLYLGFVLATITGTQTHEMGHYVAAKYFGFNPTLHYGSVSYGESAEQAEMEAFYDNNKKKIVSKESSPEKERFTNWFTGMQQKYFLITLAGPVQTIITGTLGLVLLFYRRKKIKLEGLKFIDWVLVILAFFWARQVLNFLVSITSVLLGKKFSTRGDEPRLSMFLELPKPTIGLITATIGAIILLWITFYLIPKNKRLTFICSGIVGCALGFWLWLVKLGPVILP